MQMVRFEIWITMAAPILAWKVEYQAIPWIDVMLLYLLYSYHKVSQTQYQLEVDHIPQRAVEKTHHLS